MRNLLKHLETKLLVCSRETRQMKKNETIINIKIKSLYKKAMQSSNITCVYSEQVTWSL